MSLLPPEPPAFQGRVAKEVVSGLIARGFGYWNGGTVTDEKHPEFGCLVANYHLGINGRSDSTDLFVRVVEGPSGGCGQIVAKFRPTGVGCQGVHVTQYVSPPSNRTANGRQSWSDLDNFIALFRRIHRAAIHSIEDRENQEEPMEQDVRISLSEILTAFEVNTIGSKVVGQWQRTFLIELEDAIRGHDVTKDIQPGQHKIRMPSTVNHMVSAGVGPASHNPDHYVLRFHREKVAAYLKRMYASPTEAVDCIVYTLDAYRKDPDCTPEEIARVESQKATHVLVAVLADVGLTGTPHTPFRLIHNLAGGNLEADKWSAEEIRRRCRESITYHNAWSTVAD